MAAAELRPESADGAFRMPGYVVRFGRDASGRVTHLVLDHARVKGMRYTRRPGRKAAEARVAVRAREGRLTAAAAAR